MNQREDDSLALLWIKNSSPGETKREKIPEGCMMRNLLALHHCVQIKQMLCWF